MGVFRDCRCTSRSELVGDFRVYRSVFGGRLDDLSNRMAHSQLDCAIVENAARHVWELDFYVTKLALALQNGVNL